MRRDAHKVGGRTMSLPGRKHHAADRAQRDVEAVRRAGQVVVHIVTAHRRLPLRRREMALECLVWMIRLPHEKDLIGPKVALECLVWMIMLPHEKDLIGPRKKARLPQKPVSMLKPVLKSLWNRWRVRSWCRVAGRKAART